MGEPWDEGATAQEKAPDPEERALVVRPEVGVAETAQSGWPSSATTQTCPLGQRTRSHGSFVHRPVELTHTVPAWQATPEQCFGWQVAVCVSQ